MAIELTTADSSTIESIRETLSAAETSRLEATKNDSRVISTEFSDTTITFQAVEFEGPAGTLGRLTVTFPSTDELYQRQLLRRLRIKYDEGGNDFRYNYSNVKVTINPGEGQIVANVLGMEWSSNNDVYDIYVDQAPTSDPFTVISIEFDYKFVNTVGLDVPNDVFGIATDDDDIDIVSGRDINLQAADDVYITAGSEFELEHNRLDGQSEEQGIELITNNDGNQYRWTFDFQGKLRLPGSSAQITTENDYGIRIGTGDLNSAPSSHIKVGGDEAFEIFGGPPGYSYKFDRKNTLTLPPSGTLSADGGAFNDGYLQWLGGASGDGFGYTTLELHPDSTRSSSDQYLIIDPTAGEPPHIHIRAGGTQDSSGAVLFLGGENSHVKVGAGGNPPITIASNNNNFIFNTDGSLIFPDSTAQSTAYLTGQLTVLLSADTEVGAEGYTVESLSGANVIVFAPRVGYTDSAFHSVTIPAPNYAGQKLTLLNVSSQGTVTVNWTFQGDGNLSTSVESGYNSDLTAFITPGQGLIWWETNSYSWGV